MSVSIDKAHLQKDLRFEYVEDPTITKIEPEWSIYRYGTNVVNVFVDGSRCLSGTDRNEQQKMWPVNKTG